MADWTVALGILIVAVLFIQIFVDYRKKLTLLMPSATEVSSRKEQMNAQIVESESNLGSVRSTIDQMRRELDRLEENRIELQARLNPVEMIEIPAAKCRIGTNTPGREEENPEHLVTISRFFIDKYEVTNLQYKEFIEVTGHRAPPHWRNRTFPDARKANHPIVNVSWEDANAYAGWTGKRLPTEAEWERACLVDGRDEYPWGKSANADCANYDNPDSKTTEVTRFDRGKSGLGVWDMCGNVGEWVSDWFDKDYYNVSPDEDPPGPSAGFQRVFRGGAFHENRMGIRGKSRHFAMPQASNDYLGFRCAMTPED